MAMKLRDRVRVAARAAVGVFSDKAQQEAFGMLSGIFPGGLGTPPTRGTRQFLEAYSQMPWLRAVTARVATAVASTQWELYVGKKPNATKAFRNHTIQRARGINRHTLIKQAKDRGELTQIESHVMLDALQDANSFQTGDSMWKVTQLHLDLVGEAYWIKERDALGTVIGLWPVPPNWVLNTPTPTNPFFRVGFRSWRGLIPDTEILWFADPDPSNPYGRGSGTAQALADELETDEYAAKHVKSFFYNGARPDLLVFPKAPERMREPDIRRLEEDWSSHNQGFWRAYKPYFLSREVGVEKFEQNFRSQQFVQLREAERNAIIQVYGLPPELLGVIENSNRSTIESADYLMSRYVTQPRLEFLRAIMQERLVPEYDERLIIDYVSPVQDDKTFALDAAKAAPWALEFDEWRELAGQEKLGGAKGKVHAFSSSVKLMDLATAIEEGKKPEPPPMFGGPGAGGVPGAGGPGAPPAKPGAPPEAPKPPQWGDEPKRADDAVEKFNASQPRVPRGQEGGGQWTDDDGPDLFLSSPSEALLAVENGEHVQIAKEDVRRFVERAADEAEPGKLDLTLVAVEGMAIFAGGLNIKRADMPQIPDEHRDDFVKSLRDQDITVTRRMMSPTRMRPTQCEIDAQNVGTKVKGYDSGKYKVEPVFVSSDGYVLDGHHRWAALAAIAMEVEHADLTMPVLRINLPHMKALAAMRAYTKAHDIANRPMGKQAWPPRRTSGFSPLEPSPVQGNDTTAGASTTTDKRGNANSGNHGHAGRPGQVGGSAPSTGPRPVIDHITDRIRANTEAWREETGNTRATMASRVRAFFERANADQRKAGAQWYPEAHAEAVRLSEQHGITVAQAAGVIAALSPLRDWTENVSDAEKVLRQIVQGTAEPDVLKLLSANVAKASEIAAGADPFDVLWRSGAGFKVRSFFTNILDPNSLEATIDTHMLRVLLGDNSIGMKEHGKYAGNAGRYEAFKQAILDVANEFDVAPAVVQATVWIVQRDENPRHSVGLRLRRSADDQTLTLLLDALDALFFDERSAPVKGGPGSGHFGHAGRPGQVGGSAPSGYADASSHASVAGEPDLDGVTRGMPEAVAKSVRQTIMDVRQASFGGGPVRESLAVIDLRTGERVGPPIVMGQKNEVTIPADMKKAVEKAIAQLPAWATLTIHTHPSSSPPSLQDFELSLSKMTQMMVVARSGDVFDLRFSRSPNELTEVADLREAVRRADTRARKLALDDTDRYVESLGYKRSGSGFFTAEGRTSRLSRQDISTERPGIEPVHQAHFAVAAARGWAEVAETYPDLITFRHTRARP